LAPRRFEFVPLWGLAVFFVYALRRVQCPRCGVRVEAIPWAEGKHQLTTTYAWFLARWAPRVSWTAVAQVFHTSWTHVYRSVAMAVAWGRAHQDLTGITAIGIDEIQWHRGHHYLTLVYQIDAGRRRLLWIGPERTVKTVLRFFRWFGVRRSRALRALGHAKNLAFRQRAVGTVEDVLVLDPSEAVTGELVGLTGRYVEVTFRGPPALRRRLARVRVTTAEAHTTRGSLIGEGA